MSEPKNLRLDLYGVAGHAEEIMRQLGITYRHATPQSFYDCWWFWNCENVPDKLPAYIEPLKLTPREAIGRGLSYEDAERIASYRLGDSQ